MPTEFPTNDFIQSLITSFTEHPEALRALLENKPINDALAAYLSAAAERLRPESKWKDIYTLRGEDKRLFDVPDFMFHERVGEHEVVSLLRLYYNDPMRVAVLFVGLTDAEVNPVMDYGRRFIPTPIPVVRRTEFFDDEADAIHWAQGLFPALETEVLEQTKPVPPPAQGGD